MEDEWICFNLIEIQVENVTFWTHPLDASWNQKVQVFQAWPFQSLLHAGNYAINDLSLLRWKVSHYLQQSSLLLRSLRSHRDLINWRITRHWRTRPYNRFLFQVLAHYKRSMQRYRLASIQKPVIFHLSKRFAVICPFDKNGELVTFQKEKEKKGIFSRSSKEEYPFFYFRKPL